MCIWSVWGTRTRAACLFLSVCGITGVVVMCAMVNLKDQVLLQLVMVLIIYYTEYFTGTRNMLRGSLLPTTTAGDQTSIAVTTTSTAPSLLASLQHTISDAIKVAARDAAVDMKLASPVAFSGYTS